MLVAFSTCAEYNSRAIGVYCKGKRQAQTQHMHFLRALEEVAASHMPTLEERVPVSQACPSQLSISSFQLQYYRKEIKSLHDIICLPIQPLVLLFIQPFSMLCCVFL